MSNPNAAGLAVNWQCFGSNGQDKADYSRGILERFTRRAPTDWFIEPEEDSLCVGNFHVKTIANPRLVRYVVNPHFVLYFDEKFAVNSNGERVPYWRNDPILADKITVHHYVTKSKEEYGNKTHRGAADLIGSPYNAKTFEIYDRNEVFDDSILEYRATRAETFDIESDAERIRRVEKTLVETLTQCALSEASAEFLSDKLETFLTCRAVAEKLGTKIGELSAEEYALAWIYTTLTKSDSLTRADIRQILKALPEILERPFQICKRIVNLIGKEIFTLFCEALKHDGNWIERSNLLYIQKILRSIE